MRSRSFSSHRPAISEAWSADIGVACVVGRYAADARSSRSLSTQRRNTESRRPSSVTTGPPERPLDTTSSAAWPLVILSKRPTLTFHSTPPGSTSLLQVSRCPLIRRRSSVGGRAVDCAVARTVGWSSRAGGLEEDRPLNGQPQIWPNLSCRPSVWKPTSLGRPFGLAGEDRSEPQRGERTVVRTGWFKPCLSAAAYPHRW